MKCFVVNLERSRERMETTARLFGDAGIPVERIDAVDGRLLSPAERRAACPPFRFYIANCHRVLPGEIGCVLSHLKGWRQAFADGSPVAAFFEDDVSIDPPRLHEAFADIEASDDPAVPTVWLLHRGIPQPASLDGRRWFDILEINDIGRVFCTPAYAINAAGARRIARILTPMANVLDAWSAYARCGVRVLAAAFPCARTRPVHSTIEYRHGFLWRQKWYRDFHWFRWRLAFRLDLFLKRFEGKRRFPTPPPLGPSGTAPAPRP